jgi:DNA-binding SARP family transcriptional activator/DNA-binding transcriptional ArsR family regulator
VTAPPRWEIRLLGRFAVLRDGREIPPADFGGRKVRTLVRILATRRGRFVSNDALTEMLWPDRPPADPAANLQVLVNRARKAAGDPGFIRTGQAGYLMPDDADCAVDADRFVSAVQDAQQLVGGDKLAALADALRDWPGDPLAEDAYADWAGGYRERINRVRQDAWEQAALLALDAGQPTRAVDYASAAVECDPLREVAALTLMRALAEAGDRAAALARYDEYRRALAEELGLDPSEEATALQQRLLSGTTRSAPRDATARDTPRRGVAFTGLPFVGRDEEVRAVLAALAGARGVTVVLAGPSGSGKSRTVTELTARVPTLVARAAAPERDEAWGLVRTLVRELLAQDITYRERLPARLDAALVTLLPELEPVGEHSVGSMEPESRRALIREAVIRLLAVADRVIALDDVQWADPTSLGLLERARARLPDLRLLLAFRPEEVSRSSPVGTVLGRMNEAVRIRLGGLSRAAVDQLVSDVDLAAAVAEHTDQTPLAVSELLRALASEGLISRDRAGRWHAVSPHAVERARDLAAHGQRQAIVARADQQPPDVQEALDLLCLLAREVPAATLAIACQVEESEMLDRLDPLQRSGLVRLGEAGWATSHDMVGEALAARMGDARRTRLHAALADALEAVGDDPAGPARHWREAGEPARAAHAYVRAARQALDSFADGEALTLASKGLALVVPAAVSSTLREIRADAHARLGDIAAARDDLRAALAAQPPGPDRARLLARLAVLASGSDDLVRAAELAELAIVEAGTDRAARAQALEVASILDMNLDRPERAGERSADALKLYQQLGDARGTGRILDARAMATFLAGDIREGGAALRRAADLFEDCGDLVRVITPRSTSGHALVFGGQPAQGLAEATAALELARTLGHPEGQAYALWHRSEALSALGHADEATADAGEALQIATRIGHRGWTATSWRAVGIAAQAAGDLHEALRAFENSLTVSEHFDLFASWAAARSALVLIAQGDDMQRAAGLVERALAIGPPLGHYEARLAHTELAAASGDPNTADLACRALHLADRGGALQGRDRLAQLAAGSRS